MEGKEVRFGVGRMRPLRGFDDRHVDRRGQLLPRQHDARRRRGDARQHDVRRGEPGRHRARASTGCSCSRSSSVFIAGPHGRAHARVPRQEDPGARDEADRPVPDPDAARRPRVRRRRRCCWIRRRARSSTPGRTVSRRSRTRSRRRANNNGSAFGGLAGNTDWYNTTLGLAMLAGRFLLIVPALAIAGSLARKQTVPGVGRHVPDRHAALRRRCSPVSC